MSENFPPPPPPMVPRPPENSAYVGKVRNTVLMVVLNFFTLGLYSIYWYYKVSQEIDTYTDQEMTPGKGIRTLLLIVCIILSFELVLPAAGTGVLFYLLTKDLNKVLRAEREEKLNPIVVGILNGIPYLNIFTMVWVNPFLIQAPLNRVWKKKTGGI